MDISRILIAKCGDEWFYLSKNTNLMTKITADQIKEPWINTDIIPENRIVLKQESGVNVYEILYETSSQMLVQAIQSKQIYLSGTDFISKAFVRSNINININYIKDGYLDNNNG